MDSSGGFSRRNFLAALTAVSLGFVRSGADQAPVAAAAGEQPLPLKIGHRAASMKMVGNFDVFKVARQIPGLMGVELQVASGTPNLRDWGAVRRYKREAHRWGITIPSLAGVWDRGVSIRSPLASLNLLQSIRAGEMLGASVILVAFFEADAPNMNDPSSYGPVVELLQKTGSQAADAGITLGLETSLSPADNGKLVDLVDHSSVKVYYDVHNMAFYGYGKQAISGIGLLGKKRICQVHVKNEERLIEEQGLVDWSATFQAFNDIGYEGWYVFETQHQQSGPSDRSDNSKHPVPDENLPNAGRLRRPPLPAARPPLPAARQSLPASRQPPKTLLILNREGVRRAVGTPHAPPRLLERWQPRPNFSPDCVLPSGFASAVREPFGFPTAGFPKLLQQSARLSLAAVGENSRAKCGKASLSAQQSGIAAIGGEKCGPALS